MQPAMSPIRDSLPFGDALLRIGRGALGAEEGKGPLPWPTFQAYLTAQWEPLVKDKWAAALQQGGVWRDTIAAAVTPMLPALDVPAPKPQSAGPGPAPLP